MSYLDNTIEYSNQTYGSVILDSAIRYVKSVDPSYRGYHTHNPQPNYKKEITEVLSDIRGTDANAFIENKIDCIDKCIWGIHFVLDYMQKNGVYYTKKVQLTFDNKFQNPVSDTVGENRHTNGISEITIHHDLLDMGKVGICILIAAHEMAHGNNDRNNVYPQNRKYSEKDKQILSKKSKISDLEMYSEMISLKALLAYFGINDGNRAYTIEDINKLKQEAEKETYTVGNQNYLSMSKLKIETICNFWENGAEDLVNAMNKIAFNSGSGKIQNQNQNLNITNDTSLNSNALAESIKKIISLNRRIDEIKK